MIGVLIDMVVLWFILNLTSRDNWDNATGRIFLMALAVTILGGAAVFFLAPSIGLLSLAAYFVVGMVVLCALGSLALRQGAIVMGVFLAYKVAFALVFMFLIPKG